MPDKKSGAASEVRKSLRFIGMLVAADIPLSAVYALFTGVPLSRALSIVIIMEGAAI